MAGSAQVEIRRRLTARAVLPVRSRWGMGGVHRSSKELAELVIDGKPDGTDFGMDEETERLESLRNPFYRFSEGAGRKLNRDSQTKIV